ncbi:hypothetical protein COCOR_07582 [Corallococcus coralloides DSM 2259]|uniref:Lipoprotein n=1 Tax=Corallococcus coralloides (strain ATCC 25202 / DSM 2259 / NBRC 100086 / M2) TaxID=1144275 RepID=H8MQE9_CORCM|nr:hypothetical protein [Corallococcus coralloides]AFE07618.1 hypothetical protein COCOR_07582 [Corallococcus coralloides DSM 2259]
MHCRWLVVALLLLSVGCAHSKRGPEAELPKYEHVFQKPLAEALAATRQLLEERGYTFEDTEDPTQLVTTWSEPDRAGSRNTTYTRYLVTGIAVAPRQSVVRIFRMTQQTTGNDIEWRKQWWKVLAERNEQVSNPFVKDVNLSIDDAETKRLSMLRGVQHGTRDLDLEQALTLRLESAPSVEVLAGNAVEEKRPDPVRAPEFYLERWKDEAVAEGPCTTSVRGLPELLHPGLTLLIGEQLGSYQVPDVVGHVVCQAAQTGLAVVLGLSLPETEQARVDKYLSSPGAPADQDALLEGRFWTRTYQDGRSSRAVMDLIDRVRALRAAGLRVTVVAYDTDVLNGSERDAAQAQVWTKRRAAKPDEVQVVLAGNTHTQVEKGTQWDPSFTPMAHLMKEDRSLVVLDMSYAQGTRWGCDLDRDSKLVCGIVGATPAPAVAARPGLSPYIQLRETAPNEPFQGLLYVGKLTASLPAILGPHMEPPKNLREPLLPPGRAPPLPGVF